MALAEQSAPWNYVCTVFRVDHACAGLSISLLHSAVHVRNVLSLASLFMLLVAVCERYGYVMVICMVEGQHNLLVGSKWWFLSGY